MISKRSDLLRICISILLTMPVMLASVLSYGNAVATDTPYTVSAKKLETVENEMRAIWVVDTFNSRVEKFDNKGSYVGQFGSSGSGNGQLSLPTKIAIDSSGNTLVVDTGNNRVEKFDNKGTYVSQFGSFGSGNGQLNTPTDIAIDSSGNLWVVDTGGDRVEEFNSGGVYQGQFGSRPRRRSA